MQGTINAISGKWKVLAIWHLGFNPKRFAQLRKLLPGVSEKVLTSQLRQLEVDGIVGRTVILRRLRSPTRSQVPAKN